MSLLHIAGGATEDKLYPEDVFATYLYTGNGTTQTINNGIDLAGKGGLVWIKKRTADYATRGHFLLDTARTFNYSLNTELTNAQAKENPAILSSFNSNGFTLANGNLETNYSPYTYTSWTFRKAPKFFDVVTYTGNGVAGRQIPHSLGCEVGMIIVKRLDSTSNWAVYHKSLTVGGELRLNDVAAQILGNTFGNGSIGIPPTTDIFTIAASINVTGATYVAYLFAHDPSADGIIQCGSWTASQPSTVTLGFEPQWMLVKKVNGAGNWFLVDNMRGADFSTYKSLSPDLPNAEGTQAGGTFSFNPDGFTYNGSPLGGGNTCIYLAIRRPMKVPTSGTEVFATSIKLNASPSFISNFVVDMALRKDSVNGLNDWYLTPRITGKYLRTNRTDSEGTRTYDKFDYMNGWQLTEGFADPVGYSWMFKRAKGFFDVVCYTGSAGYKSHNLGVTPEMFWRKSRSGTDDWVVSIPSILGTNVLILNSFAAKAAGAYAVVSGLGASSTFAFASEASSPATYITYLFSSLLGISKVGSYTGNGSSQTINCGFSTGSRFILIKRTDAAGDWYIWDTARGIVAANDPHLSLNTTAAEVTTDDSIDPASSGFIVNQNTATNINVNGASYIFLAIA